VEGPVLTRGHGGFMPGFSSLYRYSVAGGFGYAVLVNDGDRWSTLGAINQTIVRYLLATTRPPPRKRDPVPAPDLARWTGHYQLGGPEVEFLRFHTDVYSGIRLEAREGTLFLTELERGRTWPLVATGTDTFRYPREIDSSIQFIRDAQGRRAVIVHQNYFEEENAWWAWARRWALELAVMLLISTAWIPFFVFLRRNLDEAMVLLRPFLAALCLLGMSTFFDHAREAGDLGLRTGATVAVWLLSWAFGLCSYSAMTNAPRAGKEVPWFLRYYATAVAAAAVWITLHLSRYGLIGLRTWRW
jgi:hypothetical protein